jgi:hypothetical protein
MENLIEIEIFEAENQQEITENIDQKELIFLELEKEAIIDKYHYKNILEIDNDLKKDEIPKSDIISILLKWLLNYCIPIITVNKSEYNIVLQYDNPLNVFLKTDKLTKIKINNEVQMNIIGLKLEFIRRFDGYFPPSYALHQDLEVYNTGRYALLDNNTKQFTQERKMFIHAGKNILPEIIYFQDDKSTIKIINNLIKYILYVKNYYYKTFMYIPYIYKNTVEKNNPINRWDIKMNQSYKLGLSQKLLLMLNEVQKSKFGSSFIIDPLYMLQFNKLEYLYNVGNILGIESEEFLKLFEEKKQFIINQKRLEKEIKNSYIFNNKINMMLSIAKKKFNVDKLYKLSKEQTKIVDTEYNKLLIKSYNHNTMFNDLNQIIDNLHYDELNILLKKIEEKYGKKLIEKNLLDGECPHIYWKAKIFLKNKNNIDQLIAVREYLIEYYVESEEDSGYYCKICGELIADIDRSEVKLTFIPDNYKYTEDPLKIKIWKESFYILHTFVKFENLISIKNIVNSLSNGLINIIQNEKIKIYRSKITQIEALQETLMIYIDVYIFATLAVMMINNPGTLSFNRPSNKTSNYRNKINLNAEISGGTNYLDKHYLDKSYLDNNYLDKNYLNKTFFDKPYIKNATDSDEEISRNLFSGFFSVGGGNEVKERRSNNDSQIIKDALMILIKYKENAITMIKNMNIVVIKALFAQAFNWAVKNIKPINTETKLSDIDLNLTIDKPFYNYMYDMQLYAYLNNIINKIHERIDVEKVIGISFDELMKKKDNNVYSNTQLIEFKSTNFIDKYKFDSYKFHYEYITKRLYAASLLPKSPLLVSFQEKIKPLFEDEKKVLIEYKKHTIKSNMKIKLLNNFVYKYNIFSQDKINLAQYYCLNTGEKHKVASYIYEPGNLEIKPKEVGSWLLEAKKGEEESIKKVNKFKNMYIANTKCGKCGVLIENQTINETDKSNLISKFKQNDNIMEFYDYYNNLCPENDLHVFVNNKCNKCGFELSFRDKKNMEYYNKYSKKYTGIKENKKKNSTNFISNYKRNLEYKKPNKIEWTFSLKNVSDLSKKLNITYNILINLGLTENVKFKDIENSKINPSKEIKNSSSRCLKLQGYILWTIRILNILINHDNVSNIPAIIKEYIEMNKTIIKDIVKKLPTFSDFNSKDETYRYYLDSENYSNFLLEYYCGIFIQILDNNTHIDKYNILAKILLSHIIQENKLLSKPEPIIKNTDVILENTDDESMTEDSDLQSNSSESTDDADMLEDTVINYDVYDVENKADIWDIE